MLHGRLRYISMAFLDIEIKLMDRHATEVIFNQFMVVYDPAVSQECLPVVEYLCCSDMG